MGIFLLLFHTQTVACALNPTSAIDILPDEVVFKVRGLSIVGYNSSPNWGKIQLPLAGRRSHRIHRRLYYSKSNAGSNNVSFDINLREAKSDSAISPSDHVIHITDLSPTRDPEARGVVNLIGGKVAWIEQAMFSPDILTQIKILLAKEADPVREIMHEMGHHMGQYHVFDRNLMKQNSRSRKLTPQQLHDIINAPPGTFNRGSNQYRFMPMKSFIIPSN